MVTWPGHRAPPPAASSFPDDFHCLSHRNHTEIDTDLAQWSHTMSWDTHPAHTASDHALGHPRELFARWQQMLLGSSSSNLSSETAVRNQAMKEFL